MSLHEDNRNSNLMKLLMLDLEDLQSKSFPINSLILRSVNEVEPSSALPTSASKPSRMDCNDGRSTSIISFEFIQYFQLLLIRIYQMHDYLM